MLRTIAALLFLFPISISAQQWSTLGSLTSARTNMAAVYIGSGRVLVMGGSTGIPNDGDPRAIPSASCEIVDVWRRRIVPAPSMGVARSEFAALRTRDSSVVVIGGVTGNDVHGAVTGSVEMFDRERGEWRALGSLKTPRRQHSAGFIDEHRILVVGGRLQSYQSLSDAEIFDIRTGTSTPAAPFPYPINGSTLMVSHSGELVVVGGRTGGINSERRAEVYAYDPDADEWVLNAMLAQSVSGVSGLRLWDRRIIIAGGAHSDSPMRTATEVQLENIGKWKLISPMAGARAGACLAQWSENRVLVLGGIYNGLAPLATTEWIDMGAHTSTPGPRMTSARSRFVALAVPSSPGADPHVHSIIAIGGMSGVGKITASVEILEPWFDRTVGIERTSDGERLARLSPTEARVDLELASPASITVAIIATDGRIVSTATHERDAGSVSVPIDLDVASGGYLVRVVGGDRVRVWPVGVVR